MNTDSITLWKQRIKGRKSSGLKVIDWCNQNHIKHAYYYWHCKLKEIESDQKPVPVFAKVLANTKGQNDSSTMPGIITTWNEISIAVTDQNSIELAADFQRCLGKQC
jgi:hypothetical protein